MVQASTPAWHGGSAGSVATTDSFLCPGLSGDCVVSFSSAVGAAEAPAQARTSARCKCRRRPSTTVSLNLASSDAATPGTSTVLTEAHAGAGFLWRLAFWSSALNSLSACACRRHEDGEKLLPSTRAAFGADAGTAAWKNSSKGFMTSAPSVRRTICYKPAGATILANARGSWDVARPQH